MILVITIIITLFYCAIIISFVIGFDVVTSFHLKNKNTKNSFSIVIPFRNEAIELPHLLESITQLEYPKSNYELIFINDDSNDDSVAIIKRSFDKFSMTFSIINNNRKTNSPKKDAINSAIEQAKFDWIITNNDYRTCYLQF